MSKRRQHFETLGPHSGADDELSLLECSAVPTGTAADVSKQRNAFTFRLKPAKMRKIRDCCVVATSQYLIIKMKSEKHNTQQKNIIYSLHLYYMFRPFHMTVIRESQNIKEFSFWEEASPLQTVNTLFILILLLMVFQIVTQ